MKLSGFIVIIAVLVTILAPGAMAQFQNQVPTLLQPANGYTVVVPQVPVTGLNFDWMDVSGATHYELKVFRQINQSTQLVGTVTSTVSHVLYNSLENPLNPGTTDAPIEYTWRVKAFQGAVESQNSVTRNFLLVGGNTGIPPRPTPVPGGLAAPTNLLPIEDNQFTAFAVNANGLFMTWNAVAGATYYELQLVRERDSQGTQVEQLHYRMGVSTPRAYVSNLSLFGKYRYEISAVNGIGQRGARATGYFNLVEFLAADIFPGPTELPDGVVDSLDLFTLAMNWHRLRNQSTNYRADIVYQDSYIDQADLMALLIQKKGSSLAFPPPRPTPTPKPLDTPVLDVPVENFAVVFNAASEKQLFRWLAVPNATAYQLILRNVDQEVAEFIEVGNVTEFEVFALTFQQNLLGGGNYTWSVIAKAPGFLSTESERRPFTVTLNFIKMGKAMGSSLKSLWTGVGGFFFGIRAEAGTVDDKDSISLTAPQVVIPFKNQCFQIGRTTDVVWTEVEGASAYLVEITVKFQGGDTIYFPLQGTSLVEGKYSQIVDSNPGDGIVSGKLSSTLQNNQYSCRVQAIQGPTRGPFSTHRIFAFSQTCAIMDAPAFRFFDFSRDQTYNGADLLVYSMYYKSVTGEQTYLPSADLFPGEPDGLVDNRDLIEFMTLFENRDKLPIYPLLPPPLPQQPLNFSVFTLSGSGLSVQFAWQSLSSEYENPLAWELLVVSPDNGKQLYSSLQPQLNLVFTLKGDYTWKVRSISTGGIPGEWSIDQSFRIQLQDFKPGIPLQQGPSEGATIANGTATFSWSRVFRTNVKCIYDQLEIQNEQGPVVILDLYRKASQLADPLVFQTLALTPNHGTGFRWRVRTIFEENDARGFLFLNPGEFSPWRSFRLQAPSLHLAGLASFDPDLSRNGSVGYEDLWKLQSDFLLKRLETPRFNSLSDFNYDGFLNSKDFLLWQDCFERRRLPGYEPTNIGWTQLNPVETTPGNIPVIPATQAQAGVTVSWLPTDFQQYLVEWIDPANRFHTVLVKRQAVPTLISPQPGEILTYSNSAQTHSFIWSAVADAMEYAFVIREVGNPGRNLRIDIPAPFPVGATVSLSLPGSALANLGGGVEWEWYVWPQACGMFGDTSSVSPVRIVRAFLGASNPPQPPSSQLAPSIALPGSVRIPALDFGLHSWRVRALNEEGAISNPSGWMRFGIQTLGKEF